MALAYCTLLMDPDMKGNSIIMIFMERESIFGLTIGNMKENGLGIRCMGKGKLFGQTEGMLIKKNIIFFATINFKFCHF